jgi:ribosomal protein L31
MNGQEYKFNITSSTATNTFYARIDNLETFVTVHPFYTDADFQVYCSMGTTSTNPSKYVASSRRHGSCNGTSDPT